MIEYNGVMVSERRYNEVKYLIELLSTVSCVTKIILFGSVLTDECTDESDIDLIVIGTKCRSAGYTSLGSCRSKFYKKFPMVELDLFYYKENSSELNIMLSDGHVGEKGKIVWTV